MTTSHTKLIDSSYTIKIGKYGKSRSGKQKFKCRNDECSRKIFQLEYEKNACYPGVKEQVAEMAMNGAGMRDTGRVLKIAKDTVSGVLKKNKKFPETSE